MRKEKDEKDIFSSIFSVFLFSASTFVNQPEINFDKVESNKTKLLMVGDDFHSSE